MIEETQTQFNSEGAPAFPEADTETDNSAESSTGKETNTDSTQSSEGKNTDANNTGENQETNGETAKADELHKHPRWTEREDDWKERFNDQEKRHADEMRQLREDTDAKIEKALGKKDSNDQLTTTEIPSWFGGDEEQFKAFNEHLSTLTKNAKEEAIKEVKEKSESESKAVEEATQYLNDQVAELEKEGEKVDRNALLKFVLDNELVDTKGRWNYKAGFELMKAKQSQANKDKNTQTTEEKKKIAAASTSENRAETKAPAIPTTETFHDPSKRPW